MHRAPGRASVTLAPMDVKERKWTRVEYERLVEAEILGPEDRVELLGGAMIEQEPQYSPHATAIRLVQQALTEVFGSGWDVRPHMPVSLDEESVPEPDVASCPAIRATTATRIRRARSSWWRSRCRGWDSIETARAASTPRGLSRARA